MSNRTIKLVPYSKEQFPQVKTINKIPVEDATEKYQTVKVFTDEQGKPVSTGEDYFIDEQGNPLKPKELQEVVISAPAHLSDEEYRQYLLNSQNFNRRYGLPIDYDNIPLFTYNGITGKRDVNRNTYERYIAADNKSRAFNKQMDAMLAGTTAMMVSPYLLGGASAIPFHYLAPGTTVGNFIGDAAGSMAGIELANLASERFTGKTVDQHINRALDVDDNSFTGQWITPMLNPAGYATMAFSPVINASKTAITEFADNLAKNYINRTNPGLIKKTQRTFQNGLDRAKQTIYNQWNKFTKIPEIELLTKYPKVIFDRTKFTSNDPNVNPIVKEIEHTKHLIARGKKHNSNLTDKNIKIQRNVYRDALGNELSEESIEDAYVRERYKLSKDISNLERTFRNPFTGSQSISVEIPPSRQDKFIRSASSGPYIESESIVYNPFTGTNVPIKQKQAVGRNSTKYNKLSFNIRFPTRLELQGTITPAEAEYIAAKKLLASQEEVTPIIRNIMGEGYTTTEFNPIQTTEGDLQKGAQEIKTSIENIIGDEGLVAGSVYKLSNGHFQGSNLSHNPNSAPHDIEIWTYSDKAADAIAEKLGLKHTGDGKMTKKYQHPNGTEFEIAFIQENPQTGNARGDLAWQLFETYDPDRALAIKREHIFKGERFQDVDVPFTPEALYQIYQKNPELMDRRTVLDTITAASDSKGFNGLPNKQKHSDRTTQMLMDPQNVERMDDAISHLYKQIWGTTEGEKKLPSKVYHAIDYNDVEANKFFLEKLGFSKEVAEKMATNPQQVQNVFNYWYLQKMCGKRFGTFSTEKKTEENALQVLSTNVSPNGEYGSGGGGNSSTSPVWSWLQDRSDFTGLIYNPLTYKPETITNLQKVIEKYELQHNIDENILKFRRNQGESLDDYIKRVAQQSQDLDIPVTVGNRDYLGRFSMPKEEDVGQLQSGESVRVGGAFNQSGVIPTAEPIDFQGIPNVGKPNQYNFEDMLKYPEEFKEIIEKASLNNPIISEALKTAEKEHISVTEAINIKYKEVLQQKAKLESEIDKIKKSKAYTRAQEMTEFQKEQIEQKLDKLNSKLETLKKQQDQYASAAHRIGKIVNTSGVFIGLAGVGAGIYGAQKYSEEEYDSEYMQQLIQKTPQQALVQLEIDKENALNKCKSSEQKSKIEKYYNEIKSKLINYYSKESNAKIINESSSRKMKDASIAQAVQNARKKHRLGGILKYKWYK